MSGTAGGTEGILPGIAQKARPVILDLLGFRAAVAILNVISVLRELRALVSRVGYAIMIVIGRSPHPSNPHDASDQGHTERVMKPRLRANDQLQFSSLA